MSLMRLVSIQIVSNSLCRCYKETNVFWKVCKTPFPSLPLSRNLQGSNFQDPGISRKNGEIGKFARLAAPQNWLFNGSRLESWLDCLSWRRPGHEKRFRRSCPNCATISPPTGKLHYTTPPPRVSLHHLEISTIVKNFFIPLPRRLPSIPHSCARKRCRWRSHIISGQLHDFPEYGLNKYTAVRCAAFLFCSITRPSWDARNR